MSVLIAEPKDKTDFLKIIIQEDLFYRSVKIRVIRVIRVLFSFMISWQIFFLKSLKQFGMNPAKSAV